MISLLTTVKAFIERVNAWTKKMSESQESPDPIADLTTVMRAEKGGKDCYKVVGHWTQVNGEASGNGSH